MNNKPYVFISYAHRDQSAVLPCIEAMKNSGINLWYDEGIEAGSEWPEFIAEKVVSCSKFILFVSKSYLESQNCKREFNFAISRKKDILTVFLEDVNLSPGMEMQLGTYQAIYRKRFDSARRFHESICGERFFDVCRLIPSDANTHQEVPRSINYNTSQQKDNAGASASGNRVSDNSFGNAYQNTSPQNASANIPVRNRFIAALLAIFLGIFGIQKFYLKQHKLGVIYLIFCWTYIPFFIGLYEGIRILTLSNQAFAQKYNCRVK